MIVVVVDRFVEVVDKIVDRIADKLVEVADKIVGTIVVVVDKDFVDKVEEQEIQKLDMGFDKVVVAAVVGGKIGCKDY